MGVVYLFSFTARHLIYLWKHNAFVWKKYLHFYFHLIKVLYEQYTYHEYWHIIWTDLFSVRCTLVSAIAEIPGNSKMKKKMCTGFDIPSTLCLNKGFNNIENIVTTSWRKRKTRMIKEHRHADCFLQNTSFKIKNLC